VTVITLIVLAVWAAWQLAFFGMGVLLARRGGQPAWQHSGASLAVFEALQVGGVLVAVLAHGAMRVLALASLLLWPLSAARFVARTRQRSTKNATPSQ